MKGELPPLKTTVRLYPEAKPEEPRGLLGFADLYIAGAFVIKGILILQGKPKDGAPGEPFIAFPGRRGSGTAKGRYFEIAHPLAPEGRQAVKAAVLRAYRRAARAEGAPG